MKYRFVVWVNKDDLEVLIDTVLVHPVRVENTEITAATANTLLRYALKPALGLQLIDTLAHGLTIGGT